MALARNSSSCIVIGRFPYGDGEQPESFMRMFVQQEVNKITLKVVVSSMPLAGFPGPSPLRLCLFEFDLLHLKMEKLSAVCMRITSPAALLANGEKKPEKYHWLLLCVTPTMTFRSSPAHSAGSVLEEHTLVTSLPALVPACCFTPFTRARKLDSYERVWIISSPFRSRVNKSVPVFLNTATDCASCDDSGPTVVIIGHF